MVGHLLRRLPRADVRQALIEELDLGRSFDLVLVPSNILATTELLLAAARQVGPGGRLAFELTNPHWLAAGGSERFRVLTVDRKVARVEVDYPDGTIQEGEVELVWPEQVEDWLAAAGLVLVRIFGHPDAELEESPTFYVVATPLISGSGSGAPRSR
jgi:hypothetical protein